MSKTSHDYLYVMVDRFNKMCICTAVNILSYGMNSCTMYNMPIIVPCILLLRDLLLKHVWDTFLNHLWIFLSEKQVKRMDKMMLTKLRGSFKGSNRYIR
jgi:hypothetical protein